MGSMLRVLFIMLVASYTNALIVGTRPAMVPKVQLRAQEAPPPPPKGKLGATVDQDGKSNVWVRCRPRVLRASRAAPRADSRVLLIHADLCGLCAHTTHPRTPKRPACARVPPHHHSATTTTTTTHTHALSLSHTHACTHIQTHTHSKPDCNPTLTRRPPPRQAVEPTMKVEKEDKGLLAFAPVALVAVGAALAVPLLPLLFGANPDQA